LKTDDFNPSRLAGLYYFGDLQYWKHPRIAVDALVNGYDGAALRKLAGLHDVVEMDLPSERSILPSRKWVLLRPYPKRRQLSFLPLKRSNVSSMATETFLMWPPTSEYTFVVLKIQCRNYVG
jgi:hypothetical protein